jgi:two-component system phosphate regulon response regulator PhoB
MKSILIVDDDDAVLQLLGMRLRGRYRTFTTTNPAQAVALALEKKPDLVLCDFDMPGINGAEVAARLRKEFGDKMPIVFLTALVTPAEARAGAMKGERVISKGASVDELISCVQSVIGS